MKEAACLIEAVTNYLQNRPDLRLRDRRAWSVTELPKDVFDLYHKRVGTAPTNPVDFIGNFRMMLGTAIEHGIKNEVLNNLHLFGFHSISANSQASIGFSEPIKVDGYVDDILVQRVGGKFLTPFVLEIKTKYGKGADYFLYKYEVSEDYMCQAACYMKDLHAKKGWRYGKFLYILLSDANFGTLVEIDFEYIPEKEELRLLRARSTANNYMVQELHQSYSLRPRLERIRQLEGEIAEGQEPKKEYFYKHPLTPEFLSSISDYNLQKALEGKKILGDWQPSYSQYKNLHIKREGVSQEYDEEETKILKAEWRRRKPRSKKFL